MLTNAQLLVIKADILASPDLSSKPTNSDGNFDIAVAYNRLVTPPYYVWKLSVSINEIMGNGFDWTRVDNMTAGKARIWEFMTRLGAINPSQSNVRQGVLAAFPAAGDLTMRLAIFGHCYRQATRVEKLLVTQGAGLPATDQGVGPSTMGFEGPLSYSDVEQARNM